MSEAAWAVRFERRAEKDFGRLDPPVRHRVAIAVERLAADPGNTTGVRRLAGRPESRLRVGDWRVLIELDHDTHQIVVLRILPRGRAYDR